MAQLKTGVGASDTLFQHDRPNRPNRSRFDLSRITNFTLDAGMIVPFDWFLCLPGDEVDIDFEMILDTLPLINPSLTGYKVLTHWYSIPIRYLWEGFETFITRGRSGNVNLKIPQIDLFEFLYNAGDPSSKFKFFTDSDDEFNYSVLPISHHSLSSFLGVPPDVSGLYLGLKSSPDGSWSINKDYLPYTIYPTGQQTMTSAQWDSLFNFDTGAIRTGFNRYRYISALPFMAYQNIVKYNYVNQNLLQDNHSLFPVKGDHDWFLPYNATITNYLDYPSNEEARSNGRKAGVGDLKFRYDGVFTNEDKVTRLDQLRYAMFDDDYFTTGLPWLQRGDVQSLDFDLNFEPGTGALFDSDLTWRSNTSAGNIGEIINGLNEYVFTQTDLESSVVGGPIRGDDTYIGGPVLGFNSKTPYSAALNTFKRFAHSLTLNTRASAQFKLTANQFRELIAMSVWQERNARVNGSYNAMIYQHWSVSPHAEEHRPQYIGGTADYVSFSTILQSSESTDSSPLGSTAGRGSSGGSGKVGHYSSRDYSYVFGIMIIKPNTTYQQGIEHHLTETQFDDFVQPEFEGLSPEPILNKELYISANSDDEDLFAYQERYVYLKVRQNQNRGMFQCKPDKDRLFGSFTQARWFDSKPTFSYQFLVMSPDNMRRDWLAYPSQPTFKVQAASKVFVTRNLAYTSQPNTFGF